MKWNDSETKKVVTLVDNWCKTEGKMVCMSIRSKDTLMMDEICVLRTRNKGEAYSSEDIDEVIYSVGKNGTVMKSYKGSMNYVGLSIEMLQLVNAFRLGGYRHIYYNPNTTEYIVTPRSEIKDDGILKEKEFCEKMNDILNTFKCFPYSEGSWNECEKVEIKDTSESGGTCNLKVIRKGEMDLYSYADDNKSHWYDGNVFPMSIEQREGIEKILRVVCKYFDNAKKVYLVRGSFLNVKIENERLIYRCAIKDGKIKSVDAVRD